MTRRNVTWVLTGALLSFGLISDPGGGFASAAIDLTFLPAEDIDTDVDDVSISSDESVVHAFDRWHVVYAKGGEIILATRDGGGWGTPLALTADPADSRHPLLAYDQSFLHLVWVDVRSGLEEVWTKRTDDGTTWTADECLTCDAVPSRSPGLATSYSPAWWGGDPNDGVYVAYEDGVVGATRVRGRRFAFGSWGASEFVSTGSAVESQPTVARSPNEGGFFLAWVDTRDGFPVIYARHRPFAGFVDDEFPVSPQVGLDAGNPTAHTDSCCLDYVDDRVVLGYDSLIGAAVVESRFAIYREGEIILDDLLPVGRYPNVAGFAFEDLRGCAPFGGPISDHYLVSADGGSVWLTRFRGETGFPDILEEVTSSALGRGVLGVQSIDPMAEIVVVWVEDVSGTNTLRGRIAQTPAGVQWLFTEPTAPFLICPSGALTNAVQMYDRYTGDPVSTFSEYYLDMDPALAAALNLEESLPYRFEADPNPDDDFTTEFAIAGGGCSQAGDAFVYCGFFLEFRAVWPGVKSPDVDGDCWVSTDDREYVEGALGSDDFCADLDGSGLVDGADVAIVDIAFGELCASVGVEGPTPISPEVSLRAAPNPATSLTVVRIDVPASRPATLAIVDASGRLIVDYGTRRLTAGANLFTWDTRDRRGRAVASGQYFVLVVMPDRTLTERLIVLR